MPAKAPHNENATISAAALRLAANQGWEKVTLDTIAKAAKLSPATVKKRFSAPLKLVSVIAEEIDREAFTAVGQNATIPHDHLFDLLMAKFDIMQKNRKAILSMATAARHDRALSLALARATLDGAYRLAEASRLKEPPRPALALGLAAIYGWAFLAWRKDESRDMAKTMAAVDRGLRWAGKATEFLKRRS